MLGQAAWKHPEMHGQAGSSLRTWKDDFGFCFGGMFGIGPWTEGDGQWTVDIGTWVVVLGHYT